MVMGATMPGWCVALLTTRRGPWIEASVEPQMPPDAAERYPHKQAVMNAYLGILMFRLRPR